MRAWNLGWVVGLLLSPLLCQCATQGDTGDDDSLYDASHPMPDSDSGGSDATSVVDTGSSGYGDTGTAHDTGSADSGHTTDTGAEDSGTADSATGSDSAADSSTSTDSGVADSATADSHVADTNVPDTNTPVDSGSSDLACVNDLSMCVACCQNNHPEGTNTFIAAIVSCECGSGGACKNQCSGSTNYCATMMTPSNSCNTCLNTTLGTNGSCTTPVNDACNGDPDCVAYLACTNQNANCD